ncbi:MAG: OmpA family protein [Deltaproteobacteria bacterium]|nr:OmpA family protein [Deltaproteobacteria bacterium]
MSTRAGMVPGEDLAWPVPLVLLLVATVTAGAAAGEWRGQTRAANPAPAIAAPTTPQPAPVMAEPPSAQPASASAPPSASAAQATSCPRLIIHFAHAAATAPRAADGTLERLAAWLVAHPSVNTVIDGHADAVGTEHGNLVLSRSRAEQVAGALAAKGVARRRIVARGFGAFNPVEAEPEAAFNRRVVVHVRKAEGAPIDACPYPKEEVIEP